MYWSSYEYVDHGSFARKCKWSIYRQNTRKSSLYANIFSTEREGWPEPLSVLRHPSPTVSNNVLWCHRVVHQTWPLVGSLTFWSIRPTVSSPALSILYQWLIHDVGDRSAHDIIYAILEKRREEVAKQPSKQERPSIRRRPRSSISKKHSSDRQRYLTVTLRWLRVHIRRLREYQLPNLGRDCLP